MSIDNLTVIDWLKKNVLTNPFGYNLTVIFCHADCHANHRMGAFFRRMRARLGTPAAITATAHKLARIIYFMLKHRVPYHDFGADSYEQQYRERVLRNLNRRAASLGFRLEPAFLPVS